MDAARAQLLRYAGILDGTRAFAGPFHLEMHIKNGCYNTCNLCWNHSPYLGAAKWTVEEDSRELPFEVAERLLDDFARLGGRRVLISGGGEPAMHPRCVDMVAAAKSRGLECHLVTSVAPLSISGARRLVEVGLDLLIASVWAGSPESYAATHPGAPASLFPRIESLLREMTTRRRRLLRAGPSIGVSNVLSAPNAGDVEAMADFAGRVGADFFELHVGDTRPGLTDRDALTPADVARVARAVARLQESPAALGLGAARLAHAGGEVPAGRRHAEDLFFLAPSPCLDPRRDGEGAASTLRLSCAGGAPVEGARFDPADHTVKGEVDRAALRPCAERGPGGRCPATPDGRVRLPTFFLKEAVAFLRRLREHGDDLAAGRAPRPDGAASRDLPRLVDEIPCTVGWTYTRVTIDGVVVPCCKAFNKPVGRLGEASFAEVWFSPRMDEFRRLAASRPKSDPYFAPIGCYRACDNLNLNLETAREIAALPPTERQEIESGRRAFPPRAPAPCHEP